MAQLQLFFLYASSLSVTSIRIIIIVFDIAVCKPQLVFRDNYLLSFGMFTTKNVPCDFVHVCQSTYNSSRPTERVFFKCNIRIHFTFFDTFCVRTHSPFLVLTVFYDSHLLGTRVPKCLFRELCSVFTTVL